MSEPAGDLTVILIGASVCIFLLDSGDYSTTSADILCCSSYVFVEDNVHAHATSA
jgi:hypothetical protein